MKLDLTKPADAGRRKLLKGITATAVVGLAALSGVPSENPAPVEGGDRPSGA